MKPRAPVDTPPWRPFPFLTPLGGKWTFPIVDALTAGSIRFADLRRRLRINPNMLARALKLLVREGLVRRLSWPTGAPRVEYDLTTDGRELHRCLQALERWCIRHAMSNQALPDRRLVDTRQEPRLTIARRRAGAGMRAEDIEADTRWGDMPPAPLMHVSLSVRDIDKTSHALARVLRAPTPSAIQGRVEHQGATGTVLLCTFRLRNFFLEVVQDESGETPYGAFTRAHGDGLHHVGFHVERVGFAERVQWLEHRVGTRISGGSATHYALFDGHATHGTAIEMLFSKDGGGGWARACAAPVDPVESLFTGDIHVTHVGIVVEDVFQVAQAYAELFNLEPPPVRVGTPRFPPGIRAASNAHMKIAVIRRPNVSIQLLEPVGASPMRDFLDEHGNAVHHIGLSAGAHLERSVRALEQRGARRVLGRRGDSYAHMDLRHELGLVIELTGRPA